MGKLMDKMASLPTKDSFCLAFLNTPLEKYSHDAYIFLSTEPLFQVSDEALGLSRERLQVYIKECESLVRMILASKSGKLVGKGWSLDSAEDLSFLINKAEVYLVEKLGYFDAIFMMHHPDDEPDGSNIGTWGRMLKPFPRLKNIKYNKAAIGEKKYIYMNKSPIFDEDELRSILKDLQECVKISKKFPLETDDSVQGRFVSYMIEKGVKPGRAIGRELFKALDMFGYIPQHVKDYHKTMPDKDMQSGYIKSFYTTAMNGKKQKATD